MSAKNKRKATGAQAADSGSPRQEVDRLIAKGWLKDAVKAAKVCQRDHPSPEHHQLLERATLLRAQEMLAGGMVTAAREVATHLLDLKVTDPALTEPAIALLLAVGLAGDALKLQSKLDSPEAANRLSRQAADQAVLHPDRVAGLAPEIVAGARQIRSALEALTAGDEAPVLESLRSVPRTSLFADWRLFARGLAASRRGDDAEARANWDRLDPTRAAARIAQNLVTVAAPDAAAPSISRARREKLERWAFGEPVIGPLQSAIEAQAQQDWGDLIRQIGLLRLTLRRVEPALAVRVTRAVVAPVIRAAMDLGYREARTLIQQFTKAAEPLPIDPHWHRLWALVWEGPQGHIEEAEPFWRKYLETLDTVAAVRPEDRSTVRALIFTHIGAAYAEYVVGDDPDHPASRQDAAEAAQDRHRAISQLEASLKQLPTHRPTYQALLDLYEEVDEPDQGAEVARRLLEVLPTDYDALDLLADHHFRRDEAAVALGYAVRARQVKPLDRAAILREWTCLVALSRQQALDQQFDQARANMAAAAHLDPAESTKPLFLARQVALEIKAGESARAEELIAAALAQLRESASFWLSLAIEARRFKLPRAELARFEAHWAAESAKKVRGDTAGSLADLMHSFEVSKITYPGQKEHLRQVAAYLKRTTRIKYERDDLAHVCGFLARPKSDDVTGQKLAKRGQKLFPEAPEFPLILGAIEIRKGPQVGKMWMAQSYFQTALKLAEAQERSDPRAARILPEVRKMLAGMTMINRDPFGFSFPGAGGRFSSDGFAAAFASMMGGDPDADEFEDDEEAPRPAPRPSPKGKKR